MAMTIEILESFTDYTAVASGNCPMSTYWIFTQGSNNAGLVNSTLDATDRVFRIAGSSFFPTTGLRMFATGVTKLTMAIGYSVIDVPANEETFIQIVDTAGAHQMSLRVTAVGKLQVMGEGGVALATSYTNVTTYTMLRLCFRAQWNSANSVTIACSINGYDDPGLSVTADFQDSALSNFGGVKITTPSDYPGGGVAGDQQIHDLVVGTGECVDWGPVEVIEGPPDVDIVKQWTPLSGTDNFAMVDEAQANGDTDYNSTEGVGNKDIFGFSDPEVPEYIVALGMVSWSKKEDSATRRYRHLLRVGGVDYPAPDIFCAESYGRRIDAWLQNPATAADWDPADLAPLQFGYEYLGV